MAENELTALEDVTGEVPAIPAEVDVSTEQPADGAPPTEIDTTPDAATLEADIQALQARKEKAQKEAGYWQRKELENRRAAMQPETPPAPKTETPAAAEPKPDDFDDYNDYVSAIADHRVKVAREQWEAEAANKTAQENSAKRQADLQSKLEGGFTKYDDFAEVAFDHTAIHITPMVVDILSDCDNPADVAYYLAKNRVEGVAISRLTPTQAARKIAAIDLSFSDSSQPPLTKKTTNAPPPIKPVGASNAVVDKNPEKMTQAEYNAWRDKQGAKRY